MNQQFVPSDDYSGSSGNRRHYQYQNYNTHPEADFYAMNRAFSNVTVNDRSDAQYGYTSNNYPTAGYENGAQNKFSAESSDCDCCRGNPYNCADETCKNLGICGCVYNNADMPDFGPMDSPGPGGYSPGAGDADGFDGEDETDLFVGDSRECKCCQGYIFKCQKLEALCHSGSCYCNIEGVDSANAARAQEPVSQEARRNVGLHAQAAPFVPGALSDGAKGNTFVRSKSDSS